MREAGVLLHPTSLPSQFGVGDWGDSTFVWIEKLADAGVSWWQVLPLTPPDRFGSPYASHSAFALNPIFIDSTEVRDLVTRNTWRNFLDDVSLYDDDFFDFTSVRDAKDTLMRAAFEQFEPDDAFRQFVTRSEWLEDFALFESLKRHHNGGWWEWADPIRSRDERALQTSRDQFARDIEFEKFRQWVAHSQWRRVKELCENRGVKILGDIPIFVSLDSVDVWANQSIFQIESGRPTHVAGVPPDYFSPTGQKWGNPLYDWDALKQEHYTWWFARIARAQELADESRIDHFRGFESYWSVPVDAPTAETGVWEPGPGPEFFSAIRTHFGEVPFVAEDLGLITPEVIALRDAFDLPGMRVMQFGFDDDQADHVFRPHTFTKRSVAYIGTHDNDTLMGWYTDASDDVRHRVRTYFSCPDEGVTDAMLDALFQSESDRVFVTPQDLLRLGTDARMNAPGTADGNWSWRMSFEQLHDDEMWHGLRKRLPR